jgi:divalent metal cation (Fe/Co/Zn/Cd) transporter
METHISVDRAITVEEGHKIAKEVEHCLKRDIPDIDRVIIHVDPASIDSKEIGK